ncbi:hypothetical protein QYM36_000177 [Artemia franciscana]|uniref:Counting factor associated protein D n=1 Tax=Artemia franciscana TaxID=6661 RepID=A0AA88IPT6_ARTSF|nr:hypothetical protein QYM36_000177 [Artemia franciscana]
MRCILNLCHRLDMTAFVFNNEIETGYKQVGDKFKTLLWKYLSKTSKPGVIDFLDFEEHLKSLKAHKKPSFGDYYILRGSLNIPYAEIVEPFSAWIDFEAGDSRIDFYGGMMKTYQLANEGDYGVMYRVAPMTTETVQNEMNCFQITGAGDSPVAPQGVIPDLDDFEHVSDEVIEGEDCQVWRNITTSGDKTNTYTLWLKKQDGHAVPVRYEMKGFNNILGSHYDHYYIDYEEFSPEKPDSGVFKVEGVATSCHEFPGPGLDHVYTFNPMKEFIYYHDKHVEDNFDQFKRHHKRNYHNETEQESRKNVFRHNLRYIHSKNRANLSFRLGVNHLADRTQAELKVLRGKQKSSGGYNGGLPFKYTKKELRDVPKAFDWRLRGAVTPVRDQSVCGSCWSFGTAGAIEGALFVKTGKLVAVSQQALVDCSWGFGNNGCDGGEDFRAYQWMIKHKGIPTDESYGPYLGADGYCHLDNVNMVAPIKGYVNVTSGDSDALKVAIWKHGPISVAIDAAHLSFAFYANGVYYEPKCGNTLDDLDHAVLAVGYGTLKGEPYWLVRNSWSTYWGNDGYVLMSMRNNNCGVETFPTYVVL